MLLIFSLPSRFFAWFEYGTALMKILALLVFILVGLAIILGAGSHGYRHHGETWKSGAFQNGFKGFSNSMLLAILAIGGTSIHHIFPFPSPFPPR